MKNNCNIRWLTDCCWWTFSSSIPFKTAATCLNHVSQALRTWSLQFRHGLSPSVVVVFVMSAESRGQLTQVPSGANNNTTTEGGRMRGYAKSSIHPRRPLGVVFSQSFFQREKNKSRISTRISTQDFLPFPHNNGGFRAKAGFFS